MRMFLMTLTVVAGLAGCGEKNAKIANSDDVVRGRDVCFAAVKAADGTVLTTSGLAVKTTLSIVVYTFPATRHGADFVCKVNMRKKKITGLSKNGSSILNGVAPELRKF